MFGRSIGGLVGFVGGILVIVGGLLAGLLALLGAGLHVGQGVVGGLVVAFVAILLGIVMLFLSRPRLFWWRGRRIVTGLLLVGVAIITWLAVAANLLIV